MRPAILSLLFILLFQGDFARSGVAIKPVQVTPDKVPVGGGVAVETPAKPKREKFSPSEFEELEPVSEARQRIMGEIIQLLNSTPGNMTFNSGMGGGMGGGYGYGGGGLGYAFGTNSALDSDEREEQLIRIRNRYPQDSFAYHVINSRLSPRNQTDRLQTIDQDVEKLRQRKDELLRQYALCLKSTPTACAFENFIVTYAKAFCAWNEKITASNFSIVTCNAENAPQNNYPFEPCAVYDVVDSLDNEDALKIIAGVDQPAHFIRDLLKPAVRAAAERLDNRPGVIPKTPDPNDLAQWAAALTWHLANRQPRKDHHYAELNAFDIARFQARNEKAKIRADRAVDELRVLATDLASEDPPLTDVLLLLSSATKAIANCRDSNYFGHTVSRQVSELALPRCLGCEEEMRSQFSKYIDDTLEAVDVNLRPRFIASKLEQQVRWSLNMRLAGVKAPQDAWQMMGDFGEFQAEFSKLVDDDYQYDNDSAVQHRRKILEARVAEKAARLSLEEREFLAAIEDSAKTPPNSRFTGEISRRPAFRYGTDEAGDAIATASWTVKVRDLKTGESFSFPQTWRGKIEKAKGLPQLMKTMMTPGSPDAPPTEITVDDNGAWQITPTFPAR